MTTEREQLVERIKEAFAHARYNGHTDDNELIYAAIGECEEYFKKKCAETCETRLAAGERLLGEVR